MNKKLADMNLFEVIHEERIAHRILSRLQKRKLELLHLDRQKRFSRGGCASGKCGVRP